MAVSLDLFGTLVTVDRPDDTATAVADALAERGVAVPDDWAALFRTRHRSVDPGAEFALSAHTRDALAAGGVAADPVVVADAVTAALVPAPDEVTTRDGAGALRAAAADAGPVGVLSNCSVPGLAERCLAHSTLDPDAFDAVVTSVDCGWRKPAARAFEAVATALDADPASLVHVGDDPETDGGVTAVGGRFVPVADAPLAAAVDALEGV